MAFIHKQEYIAIFLACMFFIFPLTGLAGSHPVEKASRPSIEPPVWNFYSKLSDETIDPYLKQELAGALEFEQLEVIVQFYNEILPVDRMFLEKIGFQSEREFTAIPAVYGLATPIEIQLLSEYERTYWIEYNEQLEYLMDETTRTTNATKVWDTYITDITGEISEPIDGEGITVVVVDSGIDAGHPDLDYGEKVIYNYKSDLDGSYTSVENSDTSSGHGTHCSGTIGGTGDASAGARRGMAPGCDIIGISTGEAVSILNALGALEWVYEHSKPNSNPHNIRVVSNSWGTNADYNPEDNIVKVTEKLTYENNVAVVFAAGNAGSDNHLGETVTTNPYSLTPAVISVAAMWKTPTGIAYFSSRGSVEDNFTWPDIGAPGFHIWATEARKTLITANVKMSNQEDAMDGYYMSISGTSMATPHVAGLSALLWQAAPSLRVSNVHDDYSGNGKYVNDEFWTSPNTLIHEVELIMKLTSMYVEPDNEPVNTENDNGIPDNHSKGVNNRKYDFAQGYGFIDAEKAVALALTLERLRFSNPKATVWDALYSYENIITGRPESVETNVLTTEWTGEWSYLNDGRESTLFTNHPRYVYIPNETTEIKLVLSFEPVNIPERQIGTISLTLDYDNDGNSDWQSDLSFSSSWNGVKEDTITISGGMESNKGSLWTFNIIGQILSWPVEDIITAGNPLWVGEKDYREGLIEYRVSFQAVLDVSENETTKVDFEDLSANVGWLKFGSPTPEYSTGSIEKHMRLFDLSKAHMPEEEVDESTKSEAFPWWIIIVILILLMIGGWWFMRKRAGKPFLPSFISRKSKSKSETKPPSEAEPTKPSEGEEVDEAGRIEPPEMEALPPSTEDKK
ncbi:MAG: S8 family serine peptidase [Thermoplasmata archaeon]|nr:MAG: S8 family serine peptidase [Thermoplasmata archaeon]